MSILINEEEKIFNLQTKNTSYIMKVVKDKYLSHVYWGKKIKTPDMENASLLRNLGFSANTELEDRSYSLDYVNQEYPTGCGTDFRTPAISVLFEDGSRVLELEYDCYKIEAGKPQLNGLPATYVEDSSEADTLHIVLKDKLKDVKVILSYTAFSELDVITRSVRVVNKSNEKYFFIMTFFLLG